MPPFIDLTEQRFGRWLVLERGENTSYNHPRWWCMCECGNKKLVKGSILRKGQSKSCGCLNIDIHRQVCIERNTKHNLSKTKVYAVWVNIRQRCNNPNNNGYVKYGAKGITVCERWNSFDNFLADMGHPPTPKHSIDRIDGTKGYSPDNCRWATQKEQQNNRLNNYVISYKGERFTLMQLSEKLGIGRKSLKKRLKMITCQLSFPI